MASSCSLSLYMAFHPVSPLEAASMLLASQTLQVKWYWAPEQVWLAPSSPLLQARHVRKTQPVRSSFTSLSLIFTPPVSTTHTVIPSSAVFRVTMFWTASVQTRQCPARTSGCQLGDTRCMESCHYSSSPQPGSTPWVCTAAPRHCRTSRTIA